MAYISGDNLAKRLHERGVLTTEETRKILREVADALAYAHDRGVVHRDIKPDNILLDAVTGRPMVTDFGIARAMDAGATAASPRPAWRSARRRTCRRSRRRASARSTGAAICIRSAFSAIRCSPASRRSPRGSTPAMLVKHISERPIPVQQRRGDVPDDLARSVMMLLEKDPAHRFPTASALVAALDAREAPAVARARAATPRRPCRSRRRACSSYPPAARAAVVPADVVSSRRGRASSPHHQPTPDELRRWEAPPVQAFRKKIAPYLFVNGVIVLFAIFGSRDFL